ncbi:MAG TPA: hypothetical protein VGM27_07990 [Acidobacteriaceae bacterium]
MKCPLRLPARLAASAVSLTFCVSAYCGTAVPPPTSPTPPQANSPHGQFTPSATTTVAIPGPLKPLLRMAGISQQISPDDVLPLLARNVYTEGYQTGRPTEFLLLVDRYVHQARELQLLAGPGGVIHVNGCTDMGPLLQVLGYRLRQTCGDKSATLVTADAERAFLTIDSGFPLTVLEDALQTGASFDYPYPLTRVPVLFHESEWVQLSTDRKRSSQSLLDVLLHEPKIARLYWAMSREDDGTRLALERSAGLQKLLPYANVLDFYGAQITVRSGRVILPGGAQAESEWRDLVGASPSSPGDFVVRLLAKDNGWLAAYFDALSRVNQAQQARLTESPRLKHLYEAFHSPEPQTSAADAAFRKAPGLSILFTRLQWGPNGQLYIPGNLDVWKQILNEKSDSKIVKDWGKRAHHFDKPEQLLEAMVSLSRLDSDRSPLQIYLLLSELDRARPPDNRLSPPTALLLASKFAQLSSWYLIFCEFPELGDASIAQFVQVTGSIDQLANQDLRGNALGIFQANIGLWQIFARQGQIPRGKLKDSWQGVVQPLAKISSSTELFDQGRASLDSLLLAVSGKSNNSQDEVVALLAGPQQQSPESQRMHQEMANRMSSVLSDQRLTPLDTILALADGLQSMAQGKPASHQMLALAGELREFEMPRPIFTKREKIEWAPGVYSNPHAELQLKTDLTKVIKEPGNHAQLESARGQLTPFFRDTLVGLNYAYYEPPGAQILHVNPLFVRSHDFSGETLMGAERLWQAPQLLDAGSPAGGGAYLVGSLADLPYVLASTEEDFIAPENVQALIWKELVPGLLVGATLPRWWNVSPSELHAVALYQRAGEEILTASAANEQLRLKVVEILSDRLTPRRLDEVDNALGDKNAASIIPALMPADTFYLAATFRQKYPQEFVSAGQISKELDDLSHQSPDLVNVDRISKDFGVPHPILAQSYASELLSVKPFPAFAGYSSRLFGESWDSSNIYWARLADEMAYSPVMLNRLVPQLTRSMIAKIFATDLEDWPAVLRAMQQTGEDLRRGKISVPPPTATTSALR